LLFLFEVELDRARPTLDVILASLARDPPSSSFVIVGELEIRGLDPLSVLLSFPGVLRFLGTFYNSASEPRILAVN